MPMNEYGEIIRNSSPPPPIQPRDTNNNNRNNNSNSGGSGCAIIVGIIILVAIIGFIIYVTNNSENSEYIIPFSDSTYISYSDLSGFTQTEVMLARNEIYARHGRKFNTDSIREYFESKSWYYPQYNPDDFSESVFNQYEKENIKTIVAYEQEKGWK